MKYCPNRACPHRQRTRAPAEFLDRISACSDCGTPLVASEQEAIAGLEPMRASPYRDAPRPAALTTRSASDDTRVGWTLILGGLGMTLVTLVLGGGTYMIAVGPIAYGCYRLFRGGQATVSAAAKAAPARRPRSNRPAARRRDP